MSRRVFLRGAGALGLGSVLTACGDGSGSAVPVGDAVGYDRLVLLAEPSGQLEREWRGHHTLEWVRPDGRVVARLGGKADPAVLNSPRDAVLAPDGTLWVSDMGNHRLVRFGPDLTVLGTVTAVAGERLLRPHGLALVGSRVAVTVGSRVAITDDRGDGTWIGAPLEEHQSIAGGAYYRWSDIEAGVLDDATAVAVGADGAIVVFDREAQRITTFEPGGRARSMIALDGRASDFAMDPDGTFYVADPFRRSVHRVAADGTETPVMVYDRDRRTELLSGRGEHWRPFRLTWRQGTVDDPSGLIVSLLPAVGPD
jgi:hypothetical protein